MKSQKISKMIALLSFSFLVSGVDAYAAEYILPQTGSGGNAAESGRSAQNQQLIGAAINVGAAGMYMSICARSHCSGCWACPLVGAAAGAASMLGNASGGSGSAAASMSAYDPSKYAYGVPGAVDENGNPISYGEGGGAGSGIGAADTSGGKLPDGTTPQTIANSVAKLRSDLANAGATISADGKTMTTKDGRKFDLSKGADGSLEGLQAMGLSAMEAGQASELGKKYGAAAAAKYAGMASKLSAEGGGGGGGRSPAADGSGGKAYSFAGFGKDPFGKNREKPKLSGLTRKLGDDTIGVSGDDIFEMVTRRYKARDQVNQFLKD